MRIPALAAVSLALLLGSCLGTSSKESTEWTPLFDGSSLDAWRGYKSETVPAGWQIIDGALTRADAGGDLITREQFGSFDLRFEWRVDEGANSGVIWHVSEDHGATYETGPEYQVLDNVVLGPDGDERHAAASNYALHAPPRDFTHAPGEWNAGRLLVDGAHVKHWLNGHLVVEYDLWNDDWRALVKASKFDAMPDYGLNERGHIALQDHGDRVAYRNIRVRALD